MNKLILILTSVFLFGCSTTVPVTVKFPAAPDELKQPCLVLTQMNEDVKLSDVAKSVSNNYMEYHKCANKVQLWNEWYTEQKKNFESLK
jgi:predicted patatin/cPLA2 family phospholipase